MFSHALLSFTCDAFLILRSFTVVSKSQLGYRFGETRRKKDLVFRFRSGASTIHYSRSFSLVSPLPRIREEIRLLERLYCRDITAVTYTCLEKEVTKVP